MVASGEEASSGRSGKWRAKACATSSHASGSREICRKVDRCSMSSRVTLAEDPRQAVRLAITMQCRVSLKNGPPAR